MTHLSSPRHEIIAFIILALLPMTGLAVVAATQGGLSAFPAAIPLAMFSPALAAAIVLKSTGRRVFGAEGLNFRLGRVRWWFGGLFGTAILCAAAFALTALIDPQAMASGGELAAMTKRLGNVPDLGTPESKLFAAIALTVLIAPFLNLPLFLGEELGWRGFLTPRMVGLFGRRGVLLTGVVWALWHLPILILGHNYGAQWVPGLLVWIPLCISLSVLFTALYNLGGAIWPAALGHGVLNQIATLLTGILLIRDRFDPLIDGAAGLAGLMVFGTAASIIYFRFGSLLDVGPHSGASARSLPGRLS